MGSVRDPGETAWKKSANPHPSLAAGAGDSQAPKGTRGRGPDPGSACGEAPGPRHELMLPGALGSSKSSWGQRRAGASPQVLRLDPGIASLSPAGQGISGIYEAI